MVVAVTFGSIDVRNCFLVLVGFAVAFFAVAYFSEIDLLNIESGLRLLRF